MRFADYVLVIVVSFILAPNASAVAETTRSQPMVEPFLIDGNLNDGALVLAEHLKTNPDDDQARFGLGTLQFLQAVEQLGQKLYHYGARPQQNSFLLGGGATVPIFRLPVPHNPNPKKIKYKDARKILRRLINDLAEADGTLEQVTDSSVKLPLHFGLIRIDLDGDGHATEKEKLWRVYARLMNRRANVGSTREAAQTFTITFDKADVHWLRGYCHLISAIAETALAHDWSELFERSGHILFANVDSPYETVSDRGDFIGRILDEVALIHLVQFPVKQPKRMQTALNHFKIVIDQSRLTWQEIKKEVDNDREWIPGPIKRESSPACG